MASSVAPVSPAVVRGHVASYHMKGVSYCGVEPCRADFSLINLPNARGMACSAPDHWLWHTSWFGADYTLRVPPEDASWLSARTGLSLNGLRGWPSGRAGRRGRLDPPEDRRALPRSSCSQAWQRQLDTRYAGAAPETRITVDLHGPG